MVVKMYTRIEERIKSWDGVMIKNGHKREFTFNDIIDGAQNNKLPYGKYIS